MRAPWDAKSEGFGNGGVCRRGHVRLVARPLWLEAIVRVDEHDLVGGRVET